MPTTAATCSTPGSAQGNDRPDARRGRARARRSGTTRGNAYLDFSSQLVNLNLGHQHPTWSPRSSSRAGRLATIQPSIANDVRGELARLIAEVAPEGLEKVFFTNGGAEANEFAGAHGPPVHRPPQGALDVPQLPRLHLDRDLAHRRPPALGQRHPSIPGPCASSGPTCTARRSTPRPRSRSRSERSPIWSRRSSSRDRRRSRRSSSRPWSARTACSCRRPATCRGVRAAVRPLRHRVHRRRGHGRLRSPGRVVRAFDAFDASPDLITFAKGVNSGYVPLGGVVISDRIASAFDTMPFAGGLTYSGHPLAVCGGCGDVRGVPP